MSERERIEKSGHRAPRVENKIANPDIGKAGHRAPSGVGPVVGGGHPTPARVNPTNIVPPPKRDDSGSSAKPRK